jgi:Na+-translocating ferredoxin:NAD+ oxidoreductase RnfE subunit
MSRLFQTLHATSLQCFGFGATIETLEIVMKQTVMLSFKKKIVTDEAMRPVAVLIDYQDWQKIEQLLEAYQLQQQQDFNLNQYAGVIQLTQDPLEYQQQMRDEWH